VVGSGAKLSPEEIQEVRALLLLKEGSGLGDRRIRKLVDSFGSGSRALRAQGHQGDLLKPAPEAASVSAWLKEGIGLLPMTSPKYPASLSELTDPPSVLFWKGRYDLLTGPAVAIVGSRRATEGGRRAAETIGRTLAGAGVIVVSGMALGIDGAAHRGALQAGGDTVAVLGSGFHVIYPRPHRSLFREIGERGLLLSEFCPDEPALPHHFPKRNRIIAALAQAVVVVEAGRKSGALITVDHGLDLGRDILAVPGAVDNPQCLGSNILLREGARVLPDPSDILEELRGLGLEVGEPRKTPLTDRGIGSGIPPELQNLWAALSLEPLGVEEVAGHADLSPGEALAGLSALELGGWVRQCPGMRFQRG